MEESKMKKLANLKLASLCIQGKEESWNEIKLEDDNITDITDPTKDIFEFYHE